LFTTGIKGAHFISLWLAFACQLERPLGTAQVLRADKLAEVPPQDTVFGKTGNPLHTFICRDKTAGQIKLVDRIGVMSEQRFIALLMRPQRVFVVLPGK